MNESPRSSKRRKLDTPKLVAPNLPAKGSPRKASERASNRKTSLAKGTTAESPLKLVGGAQSSRSRNGITHGTTNATPSKRQRAAEGDVYDDIDGALRIESPAPTPTKTKTPLRRTYKKMVFDPSLPHPFKSTPTKSPAAVVANTRTPPRPVTNHQLSTKEGNINGESVNRTSVRSTTNGLRQEDVEANAQDDLVDKTLQLSSLKTSTRGGGRSANKADMKRVTATPQVALRRVSRRATEATEELQTTGSNGIVRSREHSGRRTANMKQTEYPLLNDELVEESAVATPSKLNGRRAPVQDSEDELGDLAPPSRTRSVKARRTENRVDHAGNRKDIVFDSDDDQMDVDEADQTSHLDEASNADTGSILDPMEPSPFNRKLPSTTKDLSLSLQGTLELGPHLDLLKTIVMERIAAKRPVPLVGLEEEYKSLHQLVEHTIVAGEGNSMLLIGARGSGKTALVNKVVSEVTKDNSEEFYVVRLNGFIHTDDKIALREIWRQLGKEMDVEEDSGLSKNYADTLTTLLALLSHPDEHAGEVTENVSKAVVFIMDEFELFALHPRQTLLYNLFDIAQSRKAPIAVLGLTTRIDVANSLEKRVKSRFSHRYVHLSLAKSFTAFQEICQASLVVLPEHLSIEEKGTLFEGTKNTPAKKGRKGDKVDLLSEWNANITNLFASKSFLTQHLAPHFYLTRSPSAVLTSLLLPTATLSSTTPNVFPTSILAPPDSKLALISHLSTLALSLLIAAARLDIIHDSDTCNFNMAYDEYVTLASRARIQSAAGGLSASSGISKVWGKEIARREWEILIDLSLIMPVVGGMTGAFGMVRADVALEEIGEILGGLKGIDRGLERWCRQI